MGFNNRCLRNPAKVKLISAPFFLTSDESIRLSRYLIEDCDQKRVKFDFEKTATYQVFNSILKNLFKDFQSYESTVLLDKFEKLKEVIVQKKFQIIETFFKLYQLRGDNCDYQQLQNNFQSNEIYFTPKDMNIIILMLYKESPGLYNLKFNLLFDDEEEATEID